MCAFELNYDVRTSAPTIARFHRSNADFKAVEGPIGSGKSVACCVEIFRRCKEQKVGPDGFRRSRWVVVRNTKMQLKDTTLKTWNDWFPPDQGVGYWKETDSTYFLEFGDVKAEILFRALDTPADVAKVLSLEVTGVWLNECKEIKQEIVEGLQGRLERYPSQKKGGSNYWMMIADTNMPAIGTYWWKIFEHLPLEDDDMDTLVECDTFRQPSGLSPEAENVENLVPGYYKRKAKGRSKAYVKVYIKAEYALSQAGKPVYHNSFRYDRHVSKTPLPIDPLLPVIIGQDFGLCYDELTEVLTDKGWRFFKDVDESVDKVATRNPLTGEMSFVRPAFKVAEKYKGKLIGWSSTEIDMLVTPEHRIPYTRRDYPNNVVFDSAENISKKMTSHLFVDLVASWTGEDFTPPCNLDMVTYAELMGWIASDGNICKDTNKISIAQAKSHEDLVSLLAATPFSWGKSWVRYSMSNKELREHICTEWGRTKKVRRVAKCIKNAKPKVIKAFLKTFTRGDGRVRKCANGSIGWTIYAHSRDLAGDLQELIQKCGWNSSMRVQRGQVSHLDGREIVSTDGYRVTVKRRAKRAEMHKRNYYEIDYSGMVYCLNVPYHTLYVRRNGRPHWNGNTPAGLWMQMQHNGRIFILRETPAFDMGIKRYIRSKFIPMKNIAFPTNPLVVAGDPSGVRRADSDEGTCFKEFKANGILARPAPTNDPEVRIASLDALFSEYPDMEPRVMIDPSCKSFIRAMQTEYKYKRKKFASGEEYEAKPDKSAPCSHLVEGGQYGAMFLTGRRYDPSDYVVYDEGFNPLNRITGHQPAQREGY